MVEWLHRFTQFKSTCHNPCTSATCYLLYNNNKPGILDAKSYDKKSHTILLTQQGITYNGTKSSE